MIPFGYLFMWPLADRWLGENEPPLLAALLGLALSTGLLAVGLMLLGMLPIPLINGWAVLAIIGVGWAVGLALNRGWFAPRRWLDHWREQWQALTRLDAPALLTLTLLGVMTVILVFNLHYPFLGDDTISRYGLHAQQIYHARTIPPEVVGYPPLAALNFAATWFTVGGTNEHLARVFPFAMAFGTVGATYLIGLHLRDRLTGLLAAALVALAPMFVRNATIAYVDIPTTFPLTLMTLFALRWWPDRHPREALLAGTMGAIALLTKQAALTWVASLLMIPVVWALAHRRLDGRMWAALGLMAVPSLLLAGPWYARNALLSGDVLPIAGLYHLLEQGVGWLGLLPPLTAVGDYGVWLVPVFTVGWVWGFVMATRQGIAVLRGKPDGTPAALILMAFAAPYWLAWWTTFSFDSRFLLFLLPLMALWAAEPLRGLLDRPVKLPVWGQRAAGVLLLGLLLFGAVESRLGGVYWTLRAPFATTQQRLERAKPDETELVARIREQIPPGGTHLILMDGRMDYYLLDYDTIVMYPETLAQLEGVDYVVHSSSMFAVYNSRLGLDESQFYRHVWDPLIFEEVIEVGGVHVMRVLRTTVPSQAEYDAYEGD